MAAIPVHQHWFVGAVCLYSYSNSLQIKYLITHLKQIIHKHLLSFSFPSPFLRVSYESSFPSPHIPAFLWLAPHCRFWLAHRSLLCAASVILRKGCGAMFRSLSNHAVLRAFRMHTSSCTQTHTVIRLRVSPKHFTVMIWNANDWNWAISVP